MRVNAVTSKALPIELIPVAAKIGLSNLYRAGAGTYGYVVIDGTRYRANERVIRLYNETGRTKMSTDDWSEKKQINFRAVVS